MKSSVIFARHKLLAVMRGCSASIWLPAVDKLSGRKGRVCHALPSLQCDFTQAPFRFFHQDGIMVSRRRSAFANPKCAVARAEELSLVFKSVVGLEQKKILYSCGVITLPIRYTHRAEKECSHNANSLFQAENQIINAQCSSLQSTTRHSPRAILPSRFF